MGRPKKDMLPDKDLGQLADDIMQEAKRKGCSDSYFFQTTFERYQTQLEILRNLKKSIKENETLVTKEYVKGRECIVVNPAISEYNKCATAANGTVATLFKLLNSVCEPDGSEPADPYQNYLQNACKK